MSEHLFLEADSGTIVEKQLREGEQLGYFWSRVVVAGD